MEIRPATIEDVPTIRRIAKASWHAAYDGIIGPEAVEAKTDEWYDPEALQEGVEADAGHFLVAERDGSVVAFAAVRPSEEPYADAVLTTIYAHPDRWGEGAGSALLSAATDRLAADGHADLWLAVLADNGVGLSFYRTHGFEVRVERTADLAGRTVDEYVMVRSI